MKALVAKTFRRLLLILGSLSLVAILGATAFACYMLGPGRHDKIDKASPNDVRFVLNWCQLSDHQIEKVIHSHVTCPDFDGSYLNAYSIRVSRVDPAELTSKTGAPGAHWYRGDQLPNVVNDAIHLIDAYLTEIPWFPSETDLKTSNYYVYPWSTEYDGITPAAAQLIFIRPADNTIFYFASKS